jgi:hypothetical protein
LLLKLEGKGNLASHRDVPKITSFTIDAHHAANGTLKINHHKCLRTHTPTRILLTSSIVIMPESLSKFQKQL